MYQTSHFSRVGSRLSNLDLSAVARALHESLSSPLSQKLLEMTVSGDWEGIINMRCDPRSYSRPAAYFMDAIPASLFKKIQDLPVNSHDRKAATFQKWIAAEYDCYKTNQRLYRFLPGKVHHLACDSAISRHLSGIRKIIRSWIGDRPPREIELGFSPGSTLTDRGQKATVAHKIQLSPSSTPQLDAFGYRHFIGTLWHHNMVDAGLTPTIHNGGRYFTVPKTSYVDRPAELQPSLNVSIQLGYGRTLKRLLRCNTGWSLAGTTAYKSLGWDLTKAQDIHRKVAMRASVDRSFCTIDLSSASDTVAKVLVELLLPTEWYRHLDSIRTHRIRIPHEDAPDSTYLLEKFSSMGNGFTFELETIIFAAIACYVTRHSGYWGELGFDVFVYGDDIIMRDELYSEMEAFLQFLGFTVNVNKSFFGSHPFRESCGGDYFDGVNVRPISFEDSCELKPEEIVTLCNQVRRLTDRLSEACLRDVNRLWFTLLRYLPRGISRLRGPAWLGDLVVYDPNPGSWCTRVCRETGAVEIETLDYDPHESWISWRHFDPATQLATAVLGFGDGRKGLLPRDPSFVLRTAWTTLSCN